MVKNLAREDVEEMASEYEELLMDEEETRRNEELEEEIRILREENRELQTEIFVLRCFNGETVEFPSDDKDFIYDLACFIDNNHFRFDCPDPPVGYVDMISNLDRVLRKEDEKEEEEKPHPFRYLLDFYKRLPKILTEMEKDLDKP